MKLAVSPADQLGPWDTACGIGESAIVAASLGAQAKTGGAARARCMPAVERHGAQEPGRWWNRPQGPELGSVGLHVPTLLEPDFQGQAAAGTGPMGQARGLKARLSLVSVYA